jgi:hypothetical protein
MDLAYIVAAVAFFALMLGYAKACEVLGRDRSTDPGVRRDH